MKRNSFLPVATSMILILTSGICNAQDSTLYRPPQQARRSGVVSADSNRMNIRERLVQLAIQNPSMEIEDRNVAAAAYGVRKAKTNALNQISVQGNLNEFSITHNAQASATGANLYPRYNIGFVLPLGLLTTRAQDIHIAREQLAVAEAQRNEHYRVLREAVLSKYEDYLMAVDLLNLERQVTEDAYARYGKIEKGFAEGRITDEEYTTAYRNYNTEQAKQRTLERNLRVTTIEMERYIGVKLEDVLRDYRDYR
jgi:outer membrane protein TolC